MSDLISIIVPAYNEEANVDRAYAAIIGQFTKMPGYDYEIIFCDNHSTDATFARLKVIAASDPKVRVLRYSRNFGFNRSILTGYRHASGVAAIQIDCDLEDPPELFPEFLRLWREGHDVVVGIRSRSEPKFVTALRAGFYRFLSSISEAPHTVNAGDFRLLDRIVLDQLREMDDAHPYMRGLVSELARNQAGIPYVRENKREAGESKFPVSQLVRLALQGIFSHSVAPLRVASYLGIFVALVTALITGAYLFAWIFNGQDWPSGFATTTILILFGISLNAIFLGIIGEYVGRIYTQLRKRPTAIVQESLNFDQR